MSAAPTNGNGNGKASALTSPTFQQVVAQIEAAKTEGARIQATLVAFQALDSIPMYRGQPMKVLEMAKNGEKDRVLFELKNFLTGVSEANIGLTKETAESVHVSLTTHYDTIMASILT